VSSLLSVPTTFQILWMHPERQQRFSFNHPRSVCLSALYPTLSI
jgi:hypothetical protein